MSDFKPPEDNPAFTFMAELNQLCLKYEITSVLIAMPNTPHEFYFVTHNIANSDLLNLGRMLLKHVPMDPSVDRLNIN